MRTAIVIVAGLMLAACSDPYADAKDTLARRSTDPDQVQFEGLHFGADGRVCGRVNLPNDRGGMTGFAPFVWHPSEEVAISVSYARMAALLERPPTDRLATEELNRLLDRVNEFGDEHGIHCSFE
ncbi:hypothetical protein [Maricaulis sp. MIT060901]|uniref:hypothetical protein n=1 Tax=Maricaulis sp. MIT060901 TaxID=3096993 RepID=UPI00399B5E98